MESTTVEDLSKLQTPPFVPAPSKLDSNFPFQASVVVSKAGVTYVFPYDAPNIDFIVNKFKSWEITTFFAFALIREVLLRNKTQTEKLFAIDIGAWIGTSAVWLSRFYKGVLAIEADKESLKVINHTLKLSGCKNVKICESPVYSISKEVVFGPAGNRLNESISCIKTSIHSPSTLDYKIKSKTLKQIIFDNLLPIDKIAIIKCDIEGGEEEILEDILQYAFSNDVYIHMSFHFSWWKNKDVKRFRKMMECFLVVELLANGAVRAVPDPVSKIEADPFCSLVFEKTHPQIPAQFPKLNITAVIVGYNQLTYIRMMVKQLEKYTNDIVIIDNASTYPQLLRYYDEEYTHTLFRLPQNLGSTVYENKHLLKFFGEKFILTDPDIELSTNLPENFIQQLIEIADVTHARKVGLALEIPDKDNCREDEFKIGKIANWEARFWKKRVPTDGLSQECKNLELYSAAVDTTFCLVNNRDFNIRVAGNFTSKHLPWYKGFEKELQEGELAFLKKGNISSTYL
jgi:FkbM family methyltransferase